MDAPYIVKIQILEVNKMSELALDLVEQNVVNGIDVTRLFETLELVNSNKELAKFKFRNRNRWISGGHNRSTIQGFYGACQEDTSRDEPFIYDNDEPPVLLGENKGANPVEYLLHALAGCITTTIVVNAAAKGINIDEIETDFEGDLNILGFLGLPGRTSVGYEEIRVIVRIKSDATQDQLNELVDLAERRGPVFNSVKNPVPIKVRLES